MGKCLAVLGLSLVFLAGFFFILALKEDAWVREEISIKMKDYLDVIKPYLKKYMSESGDDESLSKSFKKMDEFLEQYKLGTVEEMIKKVKYSMKMDFGLRKMCLYLTLKGFENPIKLFMPSVQWCMSNDVFRNPEKYKLPSAMRTYSDFLGFDSFYTSFICLIIAIVAAVIACIMGMTKSTSLYAKWKKTIVVITVLLSIFAVIMCVATILNITGNFKLKDKYEQGKELAMKQRGYESNYGYTYTGGYQPAETTGRNAMNLKMLKLMDMKESYGCAMYLAAAGIILLIFAVLMNVFELCVRHDTTAPPYDKVKLQGI